MTEFITNLIEISKDVFSGSISLTLFLLFSWGFIIICGKMGNALLNYIDKL